MKISKIIIRIFSMLVFSLITVLLLSFSSYAFNESEYNDEKNNANVIQVNETVYASFDSSKYCDEDNYKFTIPKDGTVSLTMNHEYFELISYMNYYFSLDGTVNSILSTSNLCWNAETQTTTRLGLSAGTYYLNFYDWADEDIPYNFILNYTETDNYEKEPDGHFKKATTVTVNREFFGTMVKQDKDVYAFSIPDDGVFSLTFKQPYENKSSTNFSLFSYNGTDKELFYSDYLDGEVETVTTSQIGLKAGLYYVSLDFLTDYSFEYSFIVNYEASDFWEKENNSNLRAASPMKTDTAYHGTISKNEKDFYVFVLEEDDEITIDFSHDYFSDNFNTKLIVFSYDGTSEYTYGTYEFKSASEKSTTQTIHLDKGEYLICISTDSYSYYKYDLTVNRKSNIGNDTIDASVTTQESSEENTREVNEKSETHEKSNSDSNRRSLIIVALAVFLIVVAIVVLVVIILNKRKNNY